MVLSWLAMVGSLRRRERGAGREACDTGGRGPGREVVVAGGWRAGFFDEKLRQDSTLVLLAFPG